MAAVTVGMMVFGWAADRLGNDVALRGIGAVLLASALALWIVMRVGSTRRLVETLLPPGDPGTPVAERQLSGPS
jgi:hypothetical protein